MLTESTHISSSHAARLLEVSSRTVNYWADAGTLNAIRTPLGRLFDRDEVEALARARQKELAAA
jgi:excisionase family DNA binding protein